MKPPNDKMPDEMRKRVMEQMPWLKNPNDLVPTVDPAAMKALWQQQKDLAAQPREPGAVLMINRKAVACSPGADIASVVHRLAMLELANKAMGLNFPVTLAGKLTDAVFKAFATVPNERDTLGREQYPSVRSF